MLFRPVDGNDAGLEAKVDPIFFVPGGLTQQQAITRHLARQVSSSTAVGADREDGAPSPISVIRTLIALAAQLDHERGRGLTAANNDDMIHQIPTFVMASDEGQDRTMPILVAREAHPYARNDPCPVSDRTFPGLAVPFSTSSRFVPLVQTGEPVI